MRPQVSSRVHGNQFRQKMAHDQRARNRSFELGDTVFIKNFADGPTWLPGVVTALHGLLICDVCRVVWRHIDHVQSRVSRWLPTETEGNCLPELTTVLPGPSGASSEPAALQIELRMLDKGVKAT